MPLTHKAIMVHSATAVEFKRQALLGETMDQTMRRLLGLPGSGGKVSSVAWLDTLERGECFSPEWPLNADGELDAEALKKETVAIRARALKIGIKVLIQGGSSRRYVTRVG